MKVINYFLSAFLISGSISLVSCSSTNKLINKNLVDSPIKKTLNTINIHQFTLENGLKVYINQNSLEPRFNAKIIVKVGSKDDPKNETGTANYIEHMLFKGTEDIGSLNYEREKLFLNQTKILYDLRHNEKDKTKRKIYQNQINAITVQASQYSIIGEFRKIYESIGAKRLKARAFKDFTEYSVDLPKNHLEQWAKIESNRFMKPVFRAFQTEVEEIHQEKNFSLDKSGFRLGREIQKNLYKKHPYRNDILGKMEHISNPSLSKTINFFNKYYIPNNTAIVISGDLDLIQTKNIITKYFGSWEQKPLPKPKRIFEKEINKIIRSEIHHKGLKSMLIGFRLPDFNSEDNNVFRLIDILLDVGNRYGLIKTNLVDTQKLMNAGSMLNLRNEYGELILYGVLNNDQSFLDVEKLLINQIEKLKSGDFSDEMIKFAVFHLKNKRSERFENNINITKEITKSFVHNISINDRLRLINDLQKISKEEIVRVANKYFKNNYVVVNKSNKNHKNPKVETEKLNAIKLNLDKKSSFYRSVSEIDVDKIKPIWVDYDKDINVSSYAPGVLFYHVENPLNDLFDLQISYDYGSNNYKNMCVIMNELDHSGTKNISSKSLINQFFKLGIKSDFFLWKK